MTPPVSHRCDEFPAEYSLASCSPALLASAFSATLMLQPITFVRRANLSERQPGNFLAVSLDGVTSVRTDDFDHLRTGAFLDVVPGPGGSARESSGFP